MNFYYVYILKYIISLFYVMIVYYKKDYIYNIFIYIFEILTYI